MRFELKQPPPAVPPKGSNETKDMGQRALSVLTSHLDWMNLRYPSGLPALFAAVEAYPQVISALEKSNPPPEVWGLVMAPSSSEVNPQKRRGWQYEIPVGEDLWGMVIRKGDSKDMGPVLRILLKNCPLPAPSQDRSGWFIRYPSCLGGVGISETKDTPKQWKQIIATRQDLFWGGSVQDQNKLANHLWNTQPHKLQLAYETLTHAKSDLMTPMLSAATFAVMAYSKRGSANDESWIKDWINAEFEWPEILPDAYSQSLSDHMMKSPLYAMAMSCVREKQISQVPPESSLQSRRRPRA